MCGIAGFNLCDKDHGVINSKKLAIELLMGIQSRGRDATGAAWFEPQAEGQTLYVQKSGVAAVQYVKGLDMPENTRTAVLHTRFATQGSHTIYENNHPVISGNIVGVHNGCLWNDDKLFRDMKIEDKRAGQVDTEAAFAAINYGREWVDGKPRLAGTLMGCLEAIEGSAALAWLEIEGNPDMLHIARVDTSPVWFAQTPNGSFIFASEKAILERACRLAGVELLESESMDEGDYFRMKDGAIVEIDKFKVQERYTWSNSKIGGYSSGVYSYTDDDFATGGYNRDGGFGTGFKYVHKDKRKDTPKVTGITEYFDAKNKAEAAKEDDTRATVVAAALAVLAVTPTDDEEFEPSVNDDDMYAHVTQPLNVDGLSRMGTGEHFHQYDLREQNIEAFMKGVKGEDNTVVQAMMDLHGTLRVGDWIMTTILNDTEIYGQVYLMPQQFPNANYILRVLIPNARYQGGEEPVLVERRADEFIAVSWSDIEASK